MDVVICLSSKDFRIIKKTISQVRKYLQNTEDKVYIIAVSSVIKLYSEQWKKQNHVVIIDENTLCPGLSFTSVEHIQRKHFTTTLHTGWYLQQFLKMGFSLSGYAGKEYLIWDSDTIPLRHLEFKKNNQYIFTPKTECNNPYFSTLRTLFGFGRLVDYSFIAEHMPINTQIMQELIHMVEQSEVKGSTWFEKILNATSGSDEYAFSEFESYGNYCVKYHPELFVTRELRTLREAGMLFGRGVKESELNLLAKMGFDTASFEYYHIPPFPRSLVNWFERQIVKFL